MTILIWIPLTRGMMNAKLLIDQTGFTDIHMRNQEIVNESDIVLHIINLHEVEEILDSMTKNIISLNINNKDLLQLELLDVRNKLMTLKPKQNRKRRGLINGIGSMSKWLFGTMDEEDRQNIQNHLLNINEVKQNNDQQVLINDYLNVTLTHLKMVITSDRRKIEKELNSINKFLETENNNNIYLEQLTNIQLLKSKIEQLQDNVVSAKYGIVHPNILTSKEIQKYDIDYNKLKYIQIGTAFFNNSYLIFGIKIPKTFVLVKLRTIVPLPNKENNEIDYNIEKTFELETKIYKFEENKHLKDLKISTHCIIKNNCQLIKNKDLEILELEMDTIIIKNAINITINQTCNSENIVLNGNYLINYNNCSIRIKDYYFSNIAEKIEERQVIDNTNIIKNFTYKLSFEEIEKEHQTNVRNIKKLKTHSNITHGCNILIIIIILIILLIVLTKHKNITIEMNKRIQENSNLKEGAVTYINADKTLDKFDEFIKSLK